MISSVVYHSRNGWQFDVSVLWFGSVWFIWIAYGNMCNLSNTGSKSEAFSLCTYVKLWALCWYRTEVGNTPTKKQMQNNFWLWWTLKDTHPFNCNISSWKQEVEYACFICFIILESCLSCLLAMYIMKMLSFYFVVEVYTCFWYEYVWLFDVDNLYIILHYLQ